MDKDEFVSKVLDMARENGINSVFVLTDGETGYMNGDDVPAITNAYLKQQEFEEEHDL